MISPFVVCRGAGLPLVCVHGNGVDHRMMLALDDAFPGFERIYLDLPGFGGTDALPFPGGLPEIADWLAATVDSLIGDQSFAVVGTSLGGLLARDLAARYLKRCVGMALLVPVVDPVREHRRVPDPVLLRGDPKLLASLDDEDRLWYSELAVEQSPTNWERFRTEVLPGLRAADQQAMARLDARYVMPIPDTALTGFDRPVLILAGRQDWVVGYEDQLELAQRFPRCTVAVLDGAGHNLQVDQPLTARALLRAWSAQVVAGL